MAKLYPESIAANQKIQESEKQVFEKLSSLDDSYHVFHSLTWNEGRDGECDFIIYNEMKGFIALEVKGGRIDFDGRTWRSVDGDGRVFDIKNPAEQARSSMFAIKKIYEKKFGNAMPGIYTWGVCFFDGNWNDACRTLDLSERNVIDIRGLDKPQIWIENLFKESEARHGVKILSAKDKNSFLSLFNRSLKIPMSISRVIEEQQKRLSTTDVNQDYLLDLFEDKNRIAFQGAAGTGKTWIAMKKAIRLASSDKKVLFLCYNKPLCSFIGEKLADHSNIEVITFHSFATGVIKDFIGGEIELHNCSDSFFGMIRNLAAAGGISSESNEKKETPGRSLELKINGAIYILAGLKSGVNYDDIINSFSGKLPETITGIISMLTPSKEGVDDFSNERLPLSVTYAFESESPHLDKFIYDAMIVDEGQDFHKNWCDTLKYIFDKYRSRIVYLFYDDNQTIFTKQKDLPINGLIAGSGINDHLFKLRDNLRNTRGIHDFAVERSGLGGTSRPADIIGLPPVEENFKNEKSAAVYIGSILEELITENGIMQEQVVILSNRSIENSIFSNEYKAGGFTLVPTGAGKRNNSVKYRTIHQFKGLESDVVILLLHKRHGDVVENEKYLFPELLYVGFSRAKHLLYVVNVE